MIILFLAAAVAQQDCDKVKGAIAQNQCWLAQSMTLDPPPDCKDRRTQFDLNVCSFRDSLRTEIELNRGWEAAAAYARAMDGHKSLEFRRLLAAQRKWIAYRDAQCAVEAGPRESGGTIWALIQNSCMEKLAKARIAELREYVESAN